jgi:hypothetical protein
MKTLKALRAFWNRLLLNSAPNPGRIWPMWEHETWGNGLSWFHPGTEVVGWLTPLPQVNDEILSKMQSGRVGRYRIVHVRPCGDPPDQFFATVAWAGYATQDDRGADATEPFVTRS